MLKNMKKIAEETSTTVMEMEGMILLASINNHTINATNITQIAEDLRYPDLVLIFSLLYPHVYYIMDLSWTYSNYIYIA